TVLGEDRITGESGISKTFILDAPARALSLRPEEVLPYATYDARIEADGFYTFLVRGIQIFADEESVLPAEMIPRGQSEDQVLEYDIGPHALRTTPENRTVGPTGDERVLGEVYIPARVTVHLGTPTSSAANVTVPFIDYIKNVASSEIYPTWPEESLRANIHCQVSFILNRVFTEWYPSRGYNFNITNSTAYDQYYVYGRNIFKSISDLVDEIFNEYIRRPGRIDPYFAEYCNGTTATCAGLSQWGTVTLAQNGKSALEILQFYYGNVELTSTNRIRAIESSYPGSPLRRGSSGRDVRTVQQQLNRIRVNYPAIPAINTVDGIFGTETENAVKTFQRIFNLTPDGVVGKSTWYRISYIYVAVKRLGELNSEGERPQYDDNSYPGLLRFGDTGSAVQNLQFYLKTIAAFNPFIPDLSIDGFFGKGTEDAVRAFQRTYGLSADGIVGEDTWNRIVSVYLDVTEGGTLTIRPYPGRLLRVGSSGDEVLYEQMLLNRIRPVFVTVGKLEEDGIFGSRMRTSVREFQRLFGYRDDGIIGRETWEALNRIFGSTVSGCFDNLSPVSGRTLRYGSQGSDVTSLQNSLNRIGSALSPIPSLQADGAFGRRTEEAVKVFQRIFGLTADGVVGTTTRTKIATVEQAVNAGCFPSSVRSITPPEARFPLPEADPLWKREFLSRHAESAPIPFAPLSVGAEGGDVLKLKEALARHGFLNLRAEEEAGYFGPSTARAVLSFQEEKGLLPTAVADEATLNTLFKL
ncbi:MAG: peptidoglycan-binding protein, partial [Clostridia bacterium]|nr:peptidoglycan-binding protein [Clostridia bacterium]